MRRFISKFAILAAMLAVPAVAYAGTQAANDACTCGEACPCSDCDCAH